MKTIELTRGKIALVDDEDYEILNEYYWQAICGRSGVWYAKRGVGQKMILMHCQLLNWNRGIDHIDRNGLNNQRSNLRKADQSVNNQNKRKKADATSEYLGVSWKTANGKWVAQVKSPGGRVHHLGLFTEEVDAARAYDSAVRKLYNGYVKTNFAMEVM